MRKGRVGLQKEVSRIFTGIQLPKKDGADTGKGPACGEQRQVTAPKPVIPQKPVTVPKPAVAPAPVITPAPVAAKTPVVTPAPEVTAKPIVEPVPVVSPAAVVKAEPIPQPKPFTIPEPAQSGVSAQNRPAYTSAVKQNVYEPPAKATRQAVYEPPPIAAAHAKQPKLEPLHKPPFYAPLLKSLQGVTAKLLAPKPGVNPGKQKAMLALMAVLPVVFIFVLSKVLLPAAPSGGTPSNKAAAAVAFDGKINWELPPVFPENIRDPMVFGAVAQNQENAGRPLVKGIVYSEDNPCAVVGERIVSPGDVVDGVTVVKINRDSVEFAMGDKNWSQKVAR
jgi:hypothetical protein